MSLIHDIDLCFARGWTDGLPVVPPYQSLVDPMVEALGWAPTEVIAYLDDFGLEVRANQLAAAAVMAGCLPAYAPVLRPLSELLLEPAFNLQGVAVTTGGAAVLVIVSGPIVEELEFAHGANAAGAQSRPNATIGRYAAMVRRFCGLAGGILEEFGVIGHPGRLSFCLAEHPETVWQPWHTQFHAAPGASAVTIMAVEGPNSVNNHYGDSGESILETIADCIAHYGSTNYYYRLGGYCVMLAPEHMALVAKSFTRDDARRFLYQRATRATAELIRLGRIPKQPEPRFAVERNAARSPVAGAEQILFIESGGSAGKFSCVIPCWVGNAPLLKELGELGQLRGETIHAWDATL